MNYTTVVRAMEHFHCQLEQAYGSNRKLLHVNTFTKTTATVAKGILDKESIKFCQKTSSNGKSKRIRSEKDMKWKDIPAGDRDKSPFLFQNACQFPGTRTEDGYYPTGDIGYIWMRRAFLYLVGRKHELIISGGKNIYPKKWRLHCVFKRSERSLVVFWELPDALWGEQVTACTRSKAGFNLTEEDVVCLVQENILPRL